MTTSHNAPSDNTPSPAAVAGHDGPRPGSRADRMAQPRARDVLRAMAEHAGVCVRPIAIRRVNVDTGHADIIDVPCGARVASKCQHTLQRINGVLSRGPVKTDGSARLVGVPLSTLAVFRQHRLAQDEERSAAGDRWRETGSVFSTKIGTPIEPRNMNRHLDALCRQADVPRIRFHDLRHSCATLLYDQGVPIENIPGCPGSQLADRDEDHLCRGDPTSPT